MSRPRITRLFQIYEFDDGSLDVVWGIWRDDGYEEYERKHYADRDEAYEEVYKFLRAEA